MEILNEDGTLIIIADVDLSRIRRVIVKDSKSVFGEIFYPAEYDEEHINVIKE